MTVSVCINTYRRPHVFKTLCSISNQDLPQNTDLEIVVTDNDHLGSGKEYVDQFTASTGILVNYAIEPNKNIALARNNGILRARGDWIAFIDDDEIAEDCWLSSLLNCLNQYNADAALGIVKAVYPSDSPNWIQRCDPLSKNWAADGTQVWGGSTCNSIIRRTSLFALDHLFDPSLGHAGCDDTDLFFRLSKANSRIFMCGGAKVYETIPPERITINYLKRRFMRNGEASSKIYHADKIQSYPLKFFFKCAARAFGFASRSSLYFLLRDQQKWLKYKIYFWTELGRIRPILRLPMIEMYR